VGDPERAQKGAAARAVYESTLTPSATIAALLDVYAAVIN
jgi:hypothetical protein